MIVKIYIYHTIRSPRSTYGAYSYILETEINKKIATLTKIGILEDTKFNKAELDVCLGALKRLTKVCDVVLVGVSNYIINGLNEWLPKWVENEFKNAKGEEVANAKEWQQFWEYTKVHHITAVGECNHEYLYWMKQETEKALKLSKNVTCEVIG